MSEHIDIAKATKSELDRMTVESKRVAEVIWESLCPEIVRTHLDEISKERGETIQMIEKLDIQIVPDKIKKVLKGYAQSGYRFDIRPIGSQSYSAVAVNYWEDTTLSSGDSECQSPEEALLAMYDRTG